ncbi:MAG: hypothetical protein J5747_11525 [Spirochaetaceae bacterium]|nr:hypothetical protein [Spirochaetaceae bacterium]
MKKRFITILISVLLILTVVSPLAALDGGGQLDSNLSFGGREWFTDDFSGIFGLTEKLTGWFRTPLPLGTLSIEAGWTLNLSYGFVWPLSLTDAQVFSVRNTLNVDLLKYNLPLSIGDYTLDINIGRFAVADCTTMIFNQNMDGVYASIPFKLFSVSAGVGYTGLQNAKRTGVYGIAVSPSDSSIYSLAPGYVAILARGSAPSLVAGQSFDAEFDMFINCNTVEESDKLSRGFASISARGSIIPLLYYNAAFSFGFALGPDSKAGIMGKAGVSYYPDFLDSAITFTTMFATTGFLPFTDLPVSNDGRIGCSDLLKIALAYSMKPTDKWVLNTDLALLYASDEEASFGLDVFQANLSAAFQWFSDVSLSASSGLVIPVSDSSVSYFTGSVRAQISF